MRTRRPKNGKVNLRATRANGGSASGKVIIVRAELPFPRRPRACLARPAAASLENANARLPPVIALDKTGVDAVARVLLASFVQTEMTYHGRDTPAPLAPAPIRLAVAIDMLAAAESNAASGFAKALLRMRVDTFWLAESLNGQAKGTKGSSDKATGEVDEVPASAAALGAAGTERHPVDNAEDEFEDKPNGATPVEKFKQPDHGTVGIRY